MSSSSEPVSAERFALAIAELPLTNVYTKAAEIRNSMSHLIQSNEQLRPDAESGDPDCAEAIEENEQVIGRMKERLQLLKHEVERRGYTWHDKEKEEEEENTPQHRAAVVDGTDHTSQNARRVSVPGADLVNGTRGSVNANNATMVSPQERSSASIPMPPTTEARSREDDEEEQGGLHL